MVVVLVSRQRAWRITFSVQFWRLNLAIRRKLSRENPFVSIWDIWVTKRGGGDNSFETWWGKDLIRKTKKRELIMDDVIIWADHGVFAANAIFDGTVVQLHVRVAKCGKWLPKTAFGSLEIVLLNALFDLLGWIEDFCGTVKVSGGHSRCRKTCWRMSSTMTITHISGDGVYKRIRSRS